MGPARLELATSSLSATRSSQLSYEPVIDRAAPSSMPEQQAEATHHAGLQAQEYLVVPQSIRLTKKKPPTRQSAALEARIRVP